jgi:G3E family GTPase
LLRMLAELVDHYGDNLYRIKGLIRFADQDRPVILQGVQRVFSPLAYAERWPSNIPATRLVVIGKGLDHTHIRMKFEMCIAADRPEFNRALGSI